MKNLTTLQLIEQTIGDSPMQVSVAQAAIVDTLLRAHQEEVARLEQQLREQVRRVLCPPERAESRGLLIEAADRFLGRGHARKCGA